MIHAVGVDALNPAGRPSPADLKALGATGIRSVFFDHPDWFSYHQAAKQAGLKSIITLARESFGSRPRDEVISNLPVNADMVVIGNEPDSPDPSSWTMSPSSFRSLIYECVPLVTNRCPSADIVAGGLVSGQPNWLLPIYQDIAALVDYLDIHPYAKTAAEAKHLLEQYYNLTQIPMVVLEWNRPANEIDAFQGMLDSTTPANAWFCWSDGMVDGFGLLNQGGHQKPEYRALQEALVVTQPPPQPDTFVVGSGIRAAMAQHQDVPASDEVYFHSSSGRTEWSACIAVSGRVYRWIQSTGRIYSYPAESN